jgi:hypothetical protein
VSVKALTWAFEQEIKPASVKFVLVAFADCVGMDGCGYPSIDAVCAKTSLDRKTVIAAFAKLEEIGVIADTGKRAGRTGQVKVYRLVGMETGQQHYVYRLTAPGGEFYIGVRSCYGKPQADAYLGSGAWPASLTPDQKIELHKEIVAVFDDREAAEQAERALISEHSANQLCMNLTVPKTESFETVPKSEPLKQDQTIPESEQYQNRNSSDISGKEYRFSAETVPETVHGTVKEPVKEPKAKARTKSRKEKQLAMLAGVDQEIALQYLEIRDAKNLPLTTPAVELIQKEAEKLQWSLGQAIRKCCEQGWAGFKASWVLKEQKEAEKDQAEISGKPWYITSTGIEEYGDKAGIKRPVNEAGFPAYKAQVLTHYKITPEMVRKANIDYSEARV